jgi:ribosomal-protein-alanine N-acetyltransferase
VTLFLERLRIDHARPFLEAVGRSTALHHPWVAPPATPEAFAALVARQGERHVSYLALQEKSQLVGCLNLSEIVRGSFESAYLGFYAFEPHAGQGLVKQALRLVMIEAFTILRLHRLEANIQPANERSRRLVESVGFREEGYSPRYLRIGGEWRDHVRYGVTVEEVGF